MSDLVRILRLELASIEADAGKLEAEAAKLQARLRLALDKADKVKAVLSVYAKGEVETNQSQMFASVEDSPERPLVDVKPRGASKAARIKAEVTYVLGARGTEYRQKILDHLISKGLMSHEKSPMASLAAYLSDHKAVFVADGRGNFPSAVKATASRHLRRSTVRVLRRRWVRSLLQARVPFRRKERYREEGRSGRSPEPPLR